MKISQDIRDTAKAAEAEAGMAEMSQKFRKGGGEIDVLVNNAPSGEVRIPNL